MFIKQFAKDDFDRKLYAGSHPAWVGENVSKNFNALRDKGITIIVSLEEKAASIIRENCAKDGLKHFTQIDGVSITVADFHPPTTEQLATVCHTILDAMEDDKKVFIHCRGGMGRTGTFLAALYMLKNDCSAKEAITYTRKTYCPWAIETEEQENSLDSFRTELTAKRHYGLK